MKRMLMTVVAAVVLSMTGTAVAKTSTKGPVAPKPGVTQGSKSDNCAEQRKHDPNAECVLDIEGETVKGQVQKPNGDDVVGRKPSGTKPLITIRTSMVDKLVKSADDQ